MSNLAELMKGQIAIDSKPNVGSQITIRMPVKAIGDNRMAISNEDETGDGLRILIVDDDTISGHIYQSQLKKSGCLAEVESDPRNAIRRVDREFYDVVLVDKNMPDMDGMDFGMAMQERVDRPTLVMITASTRRGDPGKARLAGFHGFCSKPISDKMLMKIIHAARYYHHHRVDSIATKYTVKEALQRSAVGQAKLQGRRVLVAEDNLINQRVLTGYLDRLGVEWSLAVDGQEAVDLIRQHNQSFDAILMDLQMPVMDGLVANESIRSLEKTHEKTATPILAMTATTLNQEINSCYQAGVTGHIGKPVALDELASALESAFTSGGEPNQA